MRTVTGDETPATAAPAGGERPRSRRWAAALAGPALIAVTVVVAMRGFVFANLLTNQHPDILSFWLPRSCFLGRSLAAGHVPLWNPWEMAGTPFAADPQSGWLYVPSMLLSRMLPCGTGLRAFIVLQPLMAGLGLYWFLRMERLGRPAATAGGLSLALMIAASVVGISLPFSGTLAWTPFVLVGASGFMRATRVSRRLLWMAFATFAWGQVANAHMSHGLVMATGLVTAYIAARSVRDVRAGARTPVRAALAGIGFLAFLPLANVAVFIPRFALITGSSLRAGYAALSGTVAGTAGIDRPLDTNGVWSAWPLALGSTPGAYAGAAILLMIPAAFRARGRRHLLGAFAATGAIGYVLTLNFLVAAGWFRTLVLHLPFGDVYLHNPGRIRYVALIVAPVLGALGIQGFIDRPPSLREALRWVGAGAAVFLILPLVLGAKPERFVVLALGAAALVPVVVALSRRRRWAAVGVVSVLSLELMGGALWSSAYQGGTVYLGLEGADHPNLVPGPLRWPRVSVEDYLTPSPIARYLKSEGGGSRYLAWIPPTAYFEKGYLWTQKERDWPALEMGRGILFEIPDTLGYSPIQVARYFSYIRATNRLPVFYNASVIQKPSIEDLRLLGARYLIVPEGVAPTVPGAAVAREDGYDLYEVDGWQPRVSVVSHWIRAGDPVVALREVLERGFNPAIQAVVEDDPGIPNAPADAPPGGATYREVRPEDVRITAEATVPSLVVVRNAWDEGWTATVDGQPVPVLRADYFLQAVPVPGGVHEVRLTYRDPSLARGIAGSALVWIILAAAATAALTRERRSRRD